MRTTLIKTEHFCLEEIRYEYIDHYVRMLHIDNHAYGLEVDLEHADMPRHIGTNEKQVLVNKVLLHIFSGIYSNTDEISQEFEEAIEFIKNVKQYISEHAWNN